MAFSPNDVLNATLGSSSGLGALGNFTKVVRNSIFNIFKAVEVGRFDPSFVQSGFQFSLGRMGTAGASVQAYPNSVYPRTYSIGSQQPSANVLIKKRAFTTLRNSNDIKFLDSAERSLIRATKRLFQLKAFQIATYEALSKFEQVLQNEKSLNVPYLLSMLQNASAFGALDSDEVNDLTSTLLQITQRDLASQDTNFTTWFIDQFDLDIADIGNGVGVIEFTNFTSLNTSNNMSGDPGSASMSFEDPYHVMMISNEDIGLAIVNSVYDGVTSMLGDGSIQELANNLNSFKNNSSSDIVMRAEANAAANTINNISLDAMNPNHFETPEAVHYIRSKLRKFYLGKSVIQPTDAAYIYMKSDTTYENSQDPVGLPLSLDRFGVDEEILKQEMYDVTKDRNFDVDLYRSLRDPNAFSGACVFAGVVENVTDNYTQDGFYNLQINCKNNLWYLEQSFVNVDPALDQSQGFLHDPLSPFKLEFDTFGNIKTQSQDGSNSAPGLQLLDDNVNLLNSLKIVYETGPKRGNQATSDNIYSGAFPGSEVQQIDHFPGMLYRWKEGIATLASPINASDQNQFFLNNKTLVNNVYGLALTSTPFDSMDAANVVSLLVTGVPYNINTFVDSSLLTGATNFMARPDSRGDYNTYFNSFFEIFQRQNKVFGGFKPLLDMTVNIDNVKQLALKKISFNQLDKKIGELEQAKIDLNNRLNNIPKNVDSSEVDLVAKIRQGLEAELQSINLEQRQLIANFDAISNDLETMNNTTDALGFSLDPEQRAQQLQDYQFRQMYASNRRIEDVRFNRDNNYFIVGTEYSADLDIQAFALNLRGEFKFFNNTYEPVLEKAKEAARAVNFEFFCDQGGNVRFRAPQYNKVPLSVYYQMFALQGQNGVNLVPDFVKNLFIDNVTGIRNQIVSLNWQILIELGKDASDEVIKILNTSSGQNILEFLGNPRIDSNNNFALDDGDILNQLIEFNSADQASVDNMVAPVASGTNSKLNFQMLNYIAKQLANTFSIKTTITEDDIAQPDDASSASRRKIFFENIRRLSSQRNALVKTLRNQLSNAGLSAQDLTANNTLDISELTAQTEQAISAQKQALQQEILQVIMSGNSQGYYRPQISPEFASLIEDDTRNFIGRGSGRRFILRDDMIRSASFEEHQPEYCRIDVHGSMNLGKELSQSELRMLWAGGVDYDLWRMYGFKQGQAITVPYLHDPDTQLKPYAVFLLSQQRKKVLRGTVTLVGNEYYQLGDVVYVPDRDLLFYVTGITHDFTNGEDFSTKLTLEYGRAPGEYIPTPLDVIGKTLLKQTTANLVVTKRQPYTDTLYFPTRSFNLSAIKSTDSGDEATAKLLSFGTNQGYLVSTLVNILTEMQKPNANLIITGFKIPGTNDADIQARMQVINDWFVSPKILLNNATGSTLQTLADYKGIEPKKILQNTLDLINSNSNNNPNSNQKPNNNLDIVCSDQISTIEELKNVSTKIKMLNASQESHAMVEDPITELDQVIEVGVQYLSDSSGNNNNSGSGTIR